jgi:hypothetical protein
MRRALLVLAALAGAVGTGAPASAATPPPGAAISKSLDYVGRVPDSSLIVEGKFDTVTGRDVLVTTGTYGFRTYDVRDASRPRLLDTYQPPEILGENGYWQDEDMEIDPRRKLIIGALDPRHDDVDQASCPGIGQDSLKNRNPKCRSGFYVISYADPRNLQQIGDLVETEEDFTATRRGAAGAIRAGAAGARTRATCGRSATTTSRAPTRRRTRARHRGTRRGAGTWSTCSTWTAGPLKGGPHHAAKLARVREPRARVDKLGKVPVSGLTRESLVCPLFAAQ